MSLAVWFGSARKCSAAVVGELSEAVFMRPEKRQVI